MTATGGHANETALELKGLEADNLLAFLALLGLLHALDTARPEWRARISWLGTPMRAVLTIDGAVSQDESLAAVESGIRALAEHYGFEEANITYTGADFRRLAHQAVRHRKRADLVAALASDSVLKRDGETVEPTPLCAMFGQGHQHFLARLGALVRRDDADNTADLARALFEPWQYDDDTDSLRWDPIEDRRYAHQFGDPSEGRNKIGTVTGANRLAAIGFAVLASVPTGTGLATVGIAGRRGEYDACWPLPAVPTSLAGYRALLAVPALGSEDEAPRLAAYGVAGVARARRFQVGKFFNFERARVQML